MPGLATIDIRSDTVTQPTPAMREAMFNAEVGDDVYGDDPTVKRLEALAAERLGKEAALFVPSGTFGNQLAIHTHCQRGEEVILDDSCHIVRHESGAPAVIAGVQLRTIETQGGILPAEAVRRRLRLSDDIHSPRTGLICLENAHSNGRVVPLQAMAEVAELADAHNVPIHLDGARAFNAAAHLGCDVREITRHADSVMCCLSKGLSAPVGSMLAGSAGFIHAARRKRKLMGGGLRQAGVLAAPGILALTEMVQRLPEDHRRAQRLAKALAELPSIAIDLPSVQINMVWMRLDERIDTAQLMHALAEAGIKAKAPTAGRMRLVMHRQVDDAALERILATFRQVCR